jgi:hypothetical protein
MRARFLLPLALLLAFPSGTAGAAPRGQNFHAHLTGAAERPDPRDTPAQGQAKFHLSRDGSTIEYKLIASNIENVFAAHVHCAADRENNADVAVTLYMDPFGAGSGRHDGVLATGEFSSSTPCPDNGRTVLEAMRGGLAYVNVHTNDGDGTPNEGPGDFPGGEIRGQIEAHGPKR